MSLFFHLLIYPLVYKHQPFYYLILTNLKKRVAINFKENFKEFFALVNSKILIKIGSIKNIKTVYTSMIKILQYLNWVFCFSIYKRELEWQSHREFYIFRSKTLEVFRCNPNNVYKLLRWWTKKKVPIITSSVFKGS